MTTYDLIVIGGGRASGLAVAAAKAGKKVAIIERDRLGGACPNRGCVPSKLLIGYAETARRIREADRHFIKATLDKVDLERIFRETNHFSDGVDSRYESWFPEGTTLYRGVGKFIDNHTVEVNGEQLTAAEIVIATGAKPSPTPFPDLPVWTSDNLFPLKGNVPKSIAIVGGGFIACELANFFEAVGVETHLLVRGERLLPQEDDEISAIFAEEFSKNVTVHYNTTITDAKHTDDKFQLSFNDATNSSLETDALLYAIGRVPNTADLGIENTSIQKNERGFIPNNDYLETNVSGVYSVGDVSGRYQLQHAAAFEVNYLRQRLLKGDTSPIDYDFSMPHAVFSDPEVAGIGMTEQALKASGQAYVTVTVDWLASARSQSTRLTYPRTKLIVDPANYKILGCHLIGPESSTMLQTVIMLMHLDNDVRHLKTMIHIHPALSESLLEAAVRVIAKARKYEANGV